MSKVSEDLKKRVSVSQYVVGFILSVVLTLAAYELVVGDVLNGWSLTLCLVCLATLQLLVQLVFFLHIGSEGKPRLNLKVFMYMLFLLLFFVVGTLWIMKSLNYNMMSPSETDRYILHDEGR